MCVARGSIKGICRIFLRSFDAHFFVFYGGVIFEFGSYLGNFEPKFPAVFFCRNKGVRKYALSPEHIGRQRRPFKALWRFHRILDGAGIESKGLHALRHTFATNLVNGVKQPDGTVKALTVRQVADLLGHSTTQVTEMYYVKKDMKMLDGVTNDFCL